MEACWTQRRSHSHRRLPLRRPRRPRIQTDGPHRGWFRLDGDVRDRV